MIEDRLVNGLENMGYRRMNSNVEGIYLYYRMEENEIVMVSIIRAMNGNELRPEQYHHILEQIKESFHHNYPQPIWLFALILTNHPDAVKQLCSQTKEDTHWIIDLHDNRLIIYENQRLDGYGLRDLIEELLLKERAVLAEQNQQVNRETQQRSVYRKQENPQRLKLFTMMNTLIILVNFVAFLVFQFSPFLGGKEEMLGKGALSWYYILHQNEYYRVITSMFMHSGWSHLINNMLVLLFVGDNLERAAGKFRYLFIYFGSGILAATASISYNMWKDYGKEILEVPTFSIGASGAIFGVVGAVLSIVIINRGRLEDINARQMMLFVAFSLYGGISNARIDQAAHVGGFIAGMILAAVLYRKPSDKSQS